MGTFRLLKRDGVPCGEHAGIPAGFVHNACAPCVQLPALQAWAMACRCVAGLHI